MFISNIPPIPILHLPLHRVLQETVHHDHDRLLQFLSSIPHQSYKEQFFTVECTDLLKQLPNHSNHHSHKHAHTQTTVLQGTVTSQLCTISSSNFNSSSMQPYSEQSLVQNVQVFPRTHTHTDIFVEKSHSSVCLIGIITVKTKMFPKVKEMFLLIGIFTFAYLNNTTKRVSYIIVNTVRCNF